MDSDVEQDIKNMKLKNWKKLAHERETWRKIVNEAKAHQGL